MLHLQSVPARNGLIWVRHGLKVVQRQPFALVGLFSLTMLVWTLLSLTVVGSLVTVASVPLVCLGFMLASHQVLQSHTPTVSVFAQPLQLTPERRKAQLLLGLLSVVLSVVISQIAIWVAGGAMDQLADMAKSGTQPDPAAVVAVMTDPRMIQATFTFFGLLTLVSVPLWHAPALIHWGGQGVIQSLFSSTLGVWRNKGAFLVSGIVWTVLTFTCSIVVSLVAALLGSRTLATLLQVPVFFVLSTAFLCSLYFTFIDCFMFGAPKDLPVPPTRKGGKGGTDGDAGGAGSQFSAGAGNGSTDAAWPVVSQTSERPAGEASAPAPSDAPSVAAAPAPPPAPAPASAPSSEPAAAHSAAPVETPVESSAPATATVAAGRSASEAPKPDNGEDQKPH
ncbi:hypothetical protein CDN98_21420 [Roseateles terrae]|nr:hypothetical protein CDN98_21420 [Roseateles terrae]